MTWARIDDGFFRHPKVLRAGRDARDLDMAAIFYASSFLTDGFIPEAVLPMIFADSAAVGDPADLAHRLVKERLWENTKGGWKIHDYLDYNPSRAEVLTQRSVRAEAGKLGGLRSGETRKRRANEANAEAFASRLLEAKPKQNASTLPIPNVTVPNGTYDDVVVPPVTPLGGVDNEAKRPAEWFRTLQSIPTFDRAWNDALRWVRERGISEERCEETALELKSKWGGPATKNRVEVWATFQTWVKREPLPRRDAQPSVSLAMLRGAASLSPVSNGHGSPLPPLDPDDPDWVEKSHEREKQRQAARYSSGGG